ncbi:hypothetical protein [Enterococcus asini]|uniref:hypothetical protein n=1 Tax=Enterococcus asini TaxID=57732 RepID=UPI001E3FFF7B|nr:hypothetical protein [Enterococcus asini]MCD5029101.1 hypothetical protein [Enterococcus asini]
MENHGKPISENAFVEFFKGLDENYQCFCIAELQRKIKKPPDRECVPKQADSAGMVGGPASP